MTEHHDAEALERSAERRLDALARAAGVDSERLLILSESEATLPNLGTTLWFYKLLDRERGDSRRLALDDDGRATEVDELLEKDRAAAAERRGTIQEGLHRLLARREGEEGSVPVMLRYVVDEDPLDFDKRELDLEKLDERELAELDDRARRRERDIAERASALHQDVRRDFGLPEEEVEVSGPFVRARLPVDVVPKLGRDERIAFIGRDREREVLDHPTIPESLPTTRTDTVHATGVTGEGVKIAVLEGGGLTEPASCFRIGATQDTGAADDAHMTKSVAIIGNRYEADGGCRGDWQGYAPDATVLLANGSGYQNRYDWARDKRVNVVTMSWHPSSEETSGDLGSRDVFFDYWVTRWPYPSVFTSAGNEAEDDAFASGKGYNFSGVGNVLNDGDGDRCNDSISSDSSCKNPTSPHDDHEVPALAAPGSRHELLDTSFGGTSCATPVTASIAALLMSRKVNLKIWPEAIRAILLATANYQRADGADYSRYDDGADGAGMVNAYYANLTAARRERTDIARFRGHDYGLMTADDFKDGMFTKRWRVMTTTTRSRIRVALAWNSKVAADDGSPTSSVLDADLDLWVEDADGDLVGWSTTWDNSWELVELPAGRTGTFTIRIRGYSVPSDFRSWYGVAWTTHYDLC